MLSGCEAPGAIVNTGWSSDTLTPVSPDVEAVYISDALPTLVAVRVTVWLPAMSPIVIEAMFRSLGSIGDRSPVQSDAASWPVPQMNRNQSVGPFAKTSPGSAASVG